MIRDRSALSPSQGASGPCHSPCHSPALCPASARAVRSYRLPLRDATATTAKLQVGSRMADRSPGEIAATRQMIEKIRAVYELYGFEPVETPAIEYTDALGKFLPDQDRPNEGVFSF